MARVLLSGVAKRYAAHEGEALSGVTLEARDGEFLVLVGPSGCGKSTVLRLIAGLETVTAGEIRIGDRVVNDVPPRERDIAMVFQSYALYPHLRVRDNIGFGLSVRGVPRDEIARRVREVAASLGIEALLDKHPRALSGGERQRVALGRAIVRNPRVFLFDEPLSNLDAALRVQMRAEISALHRRLGITTIYVTHDQVEAMTMGQRIAVLRGGVLQQIAEPIALYERPANRFVARFIGSPPMNVLEARQDGGAFRLAGGARVAVPAAVAAARETLLVGVRPEDLRVVAEGAPGTGGVGAATGGDASEISGAVEIVERTGSESFLYVRAAEGTIVVKLPGPSAPPAGATVTLRFCVERLHLFDPATEARIEVGSQAS
jgi:multiple sugar transport system ATP-binding protein